MLPLYSGIGFALSSIVSIPFILQGFRQGKRRRESGPTWAKNSKSGQNANPETERGVGETWAAGRQEGGFGSRRRTYGSAPRGRSVEKFSPDAGFYRVFAVSGGGATNFVFTRLFTGGMSSAVLCGHVKLAVWAISAAKSDKKNDL